MEETKIDKMEAMMNKLSDLQNSQESIIEKIGSIQVDLFEMDDDDIEEMVNDIDSRAKTTQEHIQELIEEFDMAINRAKQNDD